MGDGRFLIFSITYPNCNDIVSANFNVNAEILAESLISRYFIVKISFQLPQRVHFI